jgi:hypothetical protein
MRVANASGALFITNISLISSLSYRLVYDAPQRFANWLANHRHPDKNFKQVYLYHSRSDKHSVQLCTYVVADLLKSSETLRRDAEGFDTQRLR